MEQFIVLLIPVCILWSWLSQFGFVNPKTEGSVIQILPLPLLARLKRHAFRSVLTALISLAAVAVGSASPWWLLIALASIVGLLVAPQSYTLTNRGIRVGRGNFRRWTEFAGVYRSPAGAKLQTLGRGRDMPIWLAGSRGDDEFVHLLRRLVRDSYKGKMEPAPAPIPHESVRGDTPNLSSIAAFKREN